MAVHSFIFRLITIFCNGRGIFHLDVALDERQPYWGRDCILDVGLAKKFYKKFLFVRDSIPEEKVTRCYEA